MVCVCAGGGGGREVRVESREQRAESREQSVEGRETSSAWSFRNSGFCMPEDDRNVRHCIGEGGHASSGSTVERQCLRPTEDRVLLQALWFHHVEHPCPNNTVSLPFLVFSLPFLVFSLPFLVFSLPFELHRHGRRQHHKQRHQSLAERQRKCMERQCQWGDGQGQRRRGSCEHSRAAQF